MDKFLSDLVKQPPNDQDLSLLRVVNLGCGGLVDPIKNKWPVLCESEDLAKAMLRDEVVNVMGKLYEHPDHTQVSVKEFHMTLADARQTQRVTTKRYVAHCTFYWNRDATS